MLNYERDKLESIIPGIDRTLAAQSLEALESDPAKLAALFRNSGAPGVFVPRQYGGRGCGGREAIYLQAAVASRCPSLAIMMTMHNFTILTLQGMVELLPYTEGLFRAVASDNCLVSSGFAEGRSGADILDSTVSVTGVERGFSINGSKKPCTMTHHFDFLTAGVCFHREAGGGENAAANEPLGKQPGLAIIPGESPGIEREVFWRSPVLQGADSHEVRLNDVIVSADKVFVPDAGDPALQAQLQLIHATGLSWFQLLVSSSYLGVAAALMERLLAAKPPQKSVSAVSFAGNGVAELAASFETAVTALEGLAAFIAGGEQREAVLAKSLAVRFGVQKQIRFITEKCVEQLGGMNYIKNGDIQYLLAASHCLAFHPLSWTASTDLLVEYIGVR